LAAFARSKKKWRKMKKLIRTFLGLTLLVTAISASAQTTHQIRVNVPFSFVAGKQVSPPGNYRINIDLEHAVVALNAPDSKTTFLCMPQVARADEQRTYLRFRRFGEQWFLQEVTTLGVTQKLLLSKSEKRMIAAASHDDRILAADLTFHK
jgi:hypothetical protein